MVGNRQEDSHHVPDGISLAGPNRRNAYFSILYSACYNTSSPRDATVIESSVQASPVWLDTIRQMNRDVLCDSVVWTDFALTTDSAYTDREIRAEPQGEGLETAETEDERSQSRPPPPPPPPPRTVVAEEEVIPRQAKQILRQYFYDEYCHRLATEYGIPTLLYFRDRLKRGIHLDDGDINHRWFVDAMLCDVRFVAAVEISRPSSENATHTAAATATHATNATVSERHQVIDEREESSRNDDGRFTYDDAYMFDEDDLAMVPAYLLDSPVERPDLNQDLQDRLFQDYQMELKRERDMVRQREAGVSGAAAVNVDESGTRELNKEGSDEGVFKRPAALVGGGERRHRRSASSQHRCKLRVFWFPDIENLMSSRTSADQEHIAAVKNSMLQHMDAFNKDRTLRSFLLLFNSSEGPLDSAFARRLETFVRSPPDPLTEESIAAQVVEAELARYHMNLSDELVAQVTAGAGEYYGEGRQQKVGGFAYVQATLRDLYVEHENGVSKKTASRRAGTGVRPLSVKRYLQHAVRSGRAADTVRRYKRDRFQSGVRTRDTVRRRRPHKSLKKQSLVVFQSSSTGRDFPQSFSSRLMNHRTAVVTRKQK
ncbi:hypothetical protein J6590_076540 [Homalodisca vitripennis]|nr:hypothetical protein J6590_076540 [Homalodisca vitripennis]